MGAVDHVVALHRPASTGLAEVATFPSVYSNPIRLLRVEDPLPMCYVVDRARVASRKELYRLVTDPAFDPRSEVLLDEGVIPIEPRPGFSGGCRVVSSRADRFELAVEASSAAYVILVEAHDPGWRATVDGLFAEVLRANILFRCVRIPGGRHHVVYRYRPPQVILGLTLTGAAVLGGLVFAAWRWRGISRSGLDSRSGAST
jgi:uncharacterized membrane protein YfhO